jgi:hypothetical protein
MWHLDPPESFWPSSSQCAFQNTAISRVHHTSAFREYRRVYIELSFEFSLAMHGCSGSPTQLPCCCPASVILAHRRVHARLAHQHATGLKTTLRHPTMARIAVHATCQASKTYCMRHVAAQKAQRGPTAAATTTATRSCVAALMAGHLSSITPWPRPWTALDLRCAQHVLLPEPASHCHDTEDDSTTACWLHCLCVRRYALPGSRFELHCRRLAVAIQACC